MIEINQILVYLTSNKSRLEKDYHLRKIPAANKTTRATLI